MDNPKWYLKKRASLTSYIKNGNAYFKNTYFKNFNFAI